MWHLWDHGREVTQSSVVVLANAAAARRFPQTAHLPLRIIRGQISSVATTPELSRLRTVLCGKGYLAPARNGAHTLGATYDLDDTDLGIRTADHFRNLETLSSTDPALHELLLATNPDIWDGRVALRCTSPDYLPLIGPAPDREAFVTTYDALRRDARRIIPQRAPSHRGLFIHCALGSRGFTYAPLGAEYLADLIDHQLPALSLALQKAVHPARFVIRDLKKNRL